MGKRTEIKGIPLKAFEEMNIGEIRKLDKQFRKNNPKIKNIKLVKSYGKETKLWSKKI